MARVRVLALALLLAPRAVGASTLSITALTPAPVTAGDSVSISWTSSKVYTLPLKLYSPAITTCGAVFTTWCTATKFDLDAERGSTSIAIPLTATPGPTTFVISDCW